MGFCGAYLAHKIPWLHNFIKFYFIFSFCLGKVFGYYLLVLGGEGGIFSFDLVYPIAYVKKNSILKWVK
jgi:hypothetical protein